MKKIKIDSRRASIKVIKSIFKRKIWTKDYKGYKMKIMGVKQNIYKFIERMKRKNLRRWPKMRIKSRLKKRILQSLRVKGRGRTILKKCKFERMLFEKRFYKRLVEDPYRRYNKITGIGILLKSKLRLLCCLEKYLHYIIF